MIIFTVLFLHDFPVSRRVVSQKYFAFLLFVATYKLGFLEPNRICYYWGIKITLTRIKRNCVKCIWISCFSISFFAEKKSLQHLAYTIELYAVYKLQTIFSNYYCASDNLTLFFMVYDFSFCLYKDRKWAVTVGKNRYVFEYLEKSGQRF